MGDVRMDSSDDDVPLATLKKRAKQASKKLHKQPKVPPAPKPRPATAAAAPKFMTKEKLLARLKKRQQAQKEKSKPKTPPRPPSAKKVKKKKKRSRDADADGDASMGRSPKPSAAKTASKKTKRTKSEGDRNGAPKKKPRRASSSSSSQAKPRKAVKKEPKKKAVKELTWSQKVERAIMAFKWWEAKKAADGSRWETLEHRGVTFPEPYEPHGIRMRYNGEPVDIPPAAEELATFYAQLDPEGPQLGTPKVAKLFNANFFADFKEELGKEHIIKKFELCDFGPIRAHVEQLRAKKKAQTKAEKEVIKAKNADMKARYMYAFVDGHIEKLGNCMVEPPNLFRGRGEHPKTGTYKRRVLPEQVTLNIAAGARVPECPMPGHNWRDVIHDPKVTWLATWTENVMQQHKYVFLAASSGFKGESDLAKYEKARKLKNHIAGIRKQYIKMLKSKDKLERQIGTACWVIDVLALRVGNEKDDDEADTVGCCSLRVEHLTVDQDAGTIVFDFLGKDSMRYFEEIDFNRHGDVGKLVLKNLAGFCKGKKPNQDVLDKLTPTILNKRLTEFMPGLSAKVFRTYNASVTLEKQLEDVDESKTPQEKNVVYDAANREVAILCNHQRSVPKSFSTTFAKLEARRNLLEEQVRELKIHKRLLAQGRGDEVELKTDTEDKEEMKRESHLFKRTPSEEQVSKKINTFVDRLNKLKLNMKLKDDNKKVALSTAKINYMDPRITVAWCKRVSCPIEKVFSKALRDKFPWAMSATPDWKF